MLKNLVVCIIWWKILYLFKYNMWFETSVWFIYSNSLLQNSVKALELVSKFGLDVFSTSILILHLVNEEDRMTIIIDALKAYERRKRTQIIYWHLSRKKYYIKKNMKKGLHQEMNEKRSISYKAWRSVYVGTHKNILYQENEKNGSSRFKSHKIKEEIIY